MAALTEEFVATCLHPAAISRADAVHIMHVAPPELASIIRTTFAETGGSWQRIVELCKTFCLQHMDVFVFDRLHGAVDLSALSQRPQLVRLYCLLYDDGFDDSTCYKALQKALKLPESQTAQNAANVKSARDFVKQLTNRDAIGKRSRTAGKRSGTMLKSK